MFSKLFIKICKIDFFIYKQFKFLENLIFCVFIPQLYNQNKQQKFNALSKKF